VVRNTGNFAIEGNATQDHTSEVDQDRMAETATEKLRPESELCQSANSAR
jgi:hypothetical protein